MRLRTLFRLFLLLAAVAPITTAKADSLIIGTDTLRLDLHWLDDTPLDELARNDRVFEKKFQALIHQPTAEGFVIYIDGDRDVRGAHIVHPVPVIDIRPREILVSAGNQQHRSIGRPGSIASGEALREPGMSFRIFASRIVICPLLGIVAGRSPACRFEQQCQLFFIDGTGVV